MYFKWYKVHDCEHNGEKVASWADTKDRKIQNFVKGNETFACVRLCPLDRRKKITRRIIWYTSIVWYLKGGVAA